MATAKDYRSMSEKDLGSELIKLRSEQFNLRMHLATGNTPKIHRINGVRRDIARVKTVLNEKMKAGKA